MSHYEFSSSIDALVPKTEQKQETQYDPIDVYCIICFTPFSNQENTGLMADNYRGTKADGAMVQNQKLYFPHTKYIDDNCGKHDGMIRINSPLFIYCPADLRNNDTDSFGNFVSMKLAEDGIKKIISYNCYYHYGAITLHLAVYCFSSTEKTANHFLNESYPRLCELYNDVSSFWRIELRIEYVQVFYTYMPSQPTDQRIVCLLNELVSKDVTIWEDPKDIYAREYIAEWRIQSEKNHLFCEKGQEVLDDIGFISISAAVLVGAAALVAPELFVVSLALAKIAHFASVTSIALKCADGFTYIRDYEILHDEEAMKKGEVIFLSVAVESAEEMVLKGAKKNIKFMVVGDPLMDELKDNCADYGSWFVYKFTDELMKERYFANNNLIEGNSDMVLNTHSINSPSKDVIQMTK